jgi:Killing trait
VAENRPATATVPTPTPGTAHGSPDAAVSFSGDLTRIGAAAASVLALLNEVTAIKRQGILALAASGAQPAQPNPPGDAAAKFAEATARAHHLAQDSPESHERASVSAIAMLEQSVVHAIALAIQNTVAVDHQLDVLAQAVLTRSAVAVLQKQ